MIGNYTITFEYCNNIDTCYYTTFVIAIMRSPCETATISASALTDQSYTVTQTADNYIFTAFTSNVTSCLILYNLTDSSGNPYNSNFITFNAASYSIIIYTTSNTYVGIYSMLLTGTVNRTTTSATVSVPFNITIIHECTLSVISGFTNAVTSSMYDV
jgi:hypothetical protein